MQHAFLAEAQSGCNMATEGACGLAASLSVDTRRAKHTFEARGWQAGRQDAAERLDLHEKLLDGAADQLDRALGEQARQESLWRSAPPICCSCRSAVRHRPGGNVLQLCDAQNALRVSAIRDD